MQRLFSRSALAAAILGVGISASAQNELPRYASSAFGYSVVVPSDWRIYAESENDTMNVISFGLPEIWSELEQQQIENAIAVIALKQPDISSVQDVIDVQMKRRADILVSHTEATLLFGPAQQVITKMGNYEYKALVTYRYENGIGYEFSFNATEGTYDRNLPKFLDFLSTIEFLAPDSEGTNVYPSRLQEASFLFRTRPEAYPRVISLLEAELKDDSTNLDAAHILAIAYYEIGRFDEAVTACDRAIKMNDGIVPAMFLYKGKALFELGKYAEVEFYLGGLWALFQGDPALAREYDDLMTRLLEKLPRVDDTGSTQTPNR